MKYRASTWWIQTICLFEATPSLLFSLKVPLSWELMKKNPSAMSQDAEKVTFMLGFKYLFGFWGTKFLYQEHLCVCRWDFLKITWSIPFRKQVEWKSLSFFSLIFFFHNEKNSRSLKIILFCLSSVFNGPLLASKGKRKEHDHLYSVRSVETEPGRWTTRK